MVSSLMALGLAVGGRDDDADQMAARAMKDGKSVCGALATWAQVHVFDARGRIAEGISACANFDGIANYEGAGFLFFDCRLGGYGARFSLDREERGVIETDPGQQGECERRHPAQECHGPPARNRVPGMDCVDPADRPQPPADGDRDPQRQQRLEGPVKEERRGRRGFHGNRSVCSRGPGDHDGPGSGGHDSHGDRHGATG